MRLPRFSPHGTDIRVDHTPTNPNSSSCRRCFVAAQRPLVLGNAWQAYERLGTIVLLSLEGLHRQLGFERRDAVAIHGVKRSVHFQRADQPLHHLAEDLRTLGSQVVLFKRIGC